MTTQSQLLYSKEYEDIYCDPLYGFADKAYVFVDGHGYPARWKGQKRWIIGELGFGLGLSFFATLLRWRTHAAPSQELYYISIEKHLKRWKEITTALSFYSEASPLKDECEKLFPCESQPGFMTEFSRNVTLIILHGDIEEMVPQWPTHYGKVCAWNLDGFSPTKNPAMWGNAVEQLLFHHSTATASVATFSVAGVVRRLLQRTGFAVERRPGLAGKREILIGKKVS